MQSPRYPRHSVLRVGIFVRTCLSAQGHPFLDVASLQICLSRIFWRLIKGQQRKPILIWSPQAPAQRGEGSAFPTKGCWKSGRCSGCPRSFCPAHCLTSRGVYFLSLPSVALRLQTQSTGMCPPARHQPGGRRSNDPDTFAPKLRSTLTGLTALL